MLKTNKEYVSIKLISGEEVIGKVVPPTPSDVGGITLNKPRSLVAQQMPDGTMGGGLAPLMQMADPDQDMHFREHAIAVGPCVVFDEVKDSYIQATSPVAQMQTPKFEL